MEKKRIIEAIHELVLTVHNPEDDLDGFIRRHPSPQKCK